MGLWNWIESGQWSQAESGVEERALAVTDIGIAFDEAMVEALGTTGAPLPAVYRSGQIITDFVASLHMDEVDLRTGFVSDETPTLLTHPDPQTTPHDFFSRLMASLLWRGNAYIRPYARDSIGNIKAVHVLHPDEVTVQWDRNRIFRQYSWRDQPMIPNKEIFHISINLWPGEVEGKGPVEACRLFIAGAEAQATYLRNLFIDDATVPLVIKVAQKLTATEADEVRDIWEGKHKGRKRPAVAGGGVEIEKLALSSVDAQFIESAGFTTQQIATMFGLDGWWLNTSSGGSMNYQNTEFLTRNLLTTTLRPTYLERIEQTFSMMLPRHRGARFDPSEMVEADTKSQYEALDIAIKARILTPNEARQKLGLHPIAGGNEIAASSPPAPEQNGSAPIKGELVDAN